MDCDFCLASPYRDAAFVVACVECRQRFNCCRDCWRSAEHNHYHCKPTRSGPLRRIVADIVGRVTFERKEPWDEDDDVRTGIVKACQWPELAVRVVVGPYKAFLPGATVELVELGTDIETDEFGMAYFGKIGLRQPTVRAGKAGHVARDRSGRKAVFSFEDRGCQLARDTVVTLWLDFTCKASQRTQIKLANSDRMVSRIELEQACQGAYGMRRSPDELHGLLARLGKEINIAYMGSKASNKDEAHATAVLSLKQFGLEFDKFWADDNYDEIDREEALNASIALANTLLVTSRMPSPLELAEECQTRLEAIQELYLAEIEAAQPKADENASKEKANILHWKQLIDAARDLPHAEDVAKQRGDQITKARARVDKEQAGIERKWDEIALCKAALKTLAKARTTNNLSALGRAILACEKVISRRPPQGPPDPYEKPGCLSNQLLQRKAMLDDRINNGPIKIVTDCTRMNPMLRWQNYGMLCQALSKGVTMQGLMKLCDVWTRRTGAANDARVVGVHEVDGAFMSSVRGITEVRIVPLENGRFKLIGGGGLGEKVFAFGCDGAFNFRKGFEKREERFYAVLLPMGFTHHFGFDVRTLGVTGSSAREPSFAEFRSHAFLDPAQGKPQKNIQMPQNKVFLIRAEESTAEGQITIHFGFRQMLINDELMSMVDFLRRHVLGVVEFDRSGAVLQYTLFKPE